MRFNDFLKDRVALFLAGWGIMTAVAYLVLLAMGAGEDWAAAATYIPYDGAAIISVLILLFVVRFYGLKSFEGKVWTLILIGMALWMFAELIWGLDMLFYMMDSGAMPTVLANNSDYPFLAGYVFIAMGFLYKARYTELKPDTGKAFLVLASTGMFMIVSIFMVILPTMETSMYTGSEKFFLIAYVVLDIILFGIGLAIALYWGTAVSKGWYFLALALLSMMIADVGYTALDLQGIYFDGNLIELAWVAAYLWIAMAGHYQKKLHGSFM